MKDKKEETVKFFREHEIILIFIIIIATIFITRVLVLIENPNPTIRNFELHHFDYGLVILIATHLAIIFGKISRLKYVIFSGFSLGLIIDDYWFIRSNIIDPSINEVEIYNQTIPSIWIPLAVILIASIIFWAIKFKETPREGEKKVKQKIKILFSRLKKYFSSSFLPMILDYTLLIVLSEILGVNYIAAISLAFIIGHLVNFFSSNKKAFAGSTVKRKKIILYYTILGIISLVLMTSATWTITEFLGIHYIISKTIVTIFIGLFNFTSNYAITYDLEKELK